MKDLPAYLLAHYNEHKDPSTVGTMLADSILFFAQNYAGDDKTVVEFLIPLMKVMGYLARVKVRSNIDADNVATIIELVRELEK